MRWPIGSLPAYSLFAKDSLDQHRHRCAGHIVLVEQAAAAERDAHLLAIARRNRITKSSVGFVGSVAMLKLCAIDIRVAAERQQAGERGRLDSGDLEYGFQGFCEELTLDVVIIEAVTRFLDLHGEKVRRIEPWRDSEQALDTAQQQPRCHKKHEG